MRLTALIVGTQVFLVALVLGMALIAISALEAGDRVLESASAEGSEAARRTVSGAVGLIAISAGLSVLAILAVGAWAGRRIAAPLVNIDRTLTAVTSGHIHRRVDEHIAQGEFRGLASKLNALIDGYREAASDQGVDSLLARAAVEHLLPEASGPAGLLDLRGRLVASNQPLRGLLQQRQWTSAALLGRRPEDAVAKARLEEVRTAGVQVGFIARMGATGEAPGGLTPQTGDGDPRPLRHPAP